jgi:DNA ligase (NAD+)
VDPPRPLDSPGASVGASKTAKAEKLGVEIVDQDEIWRLLIAA